MSIVSPFFKKTFEEKNILSQIDRILLSIRGKSFVMPKKNSPVILIVSGGLDSVPLWLILLKKFHLKVHPIYFDDGNNSQKKSAVFFSSYFKRNFSLQSQDLMIIKRPYPLIINSIGKIEYSKLDPQFVLANLVYNRLHKKIMLIYGGTPTRHFYFNIVAFEQAYLLKMNKGVDINTVFSGIVPDDANGGREGTLATLRAVNLACILFYGNDKWQFEAPIDKKNNFYFTKKDLVRYALKNNLDVGKTWSCNNKGKYHCGDCPSCYVRHSVFTELRIEDPTIYRKSVIKSFVKKVKRILNIKE